MSRVRSPSPAFRFLTFEPAVRIVRACRFSLSAEDLFGFSLVTGVQKGQRLAGKLPSREQLRYLKNLGYTGALPLTMGEASAAIDVMVDAGSIAAPQRAIIQERREAENDDLEEDEDDANFGIEVEES